MKSVLAGLPSTRSCYVCWDNPEGADQTVFLAYQDSFVLNCNILGS